MDKLTASIMGQMAEDLGLINLASFAMVAPTVRQSGRTTRTVLEALAYSAQGHPVMLVAPSADILNSVRTQYSHYQRELLAMGVPLIWYDHRFVLSRNAEKEATQWSWHILTDHTHDEYLKIDCPKKDDSAVNVSEG